MRRIKEWTNLVVLIGALALLFAMLSVPVWQQNRYLVLMESHEQLQKEKVEVEHDLQLAQMEINQLRSLERLDTVAIAMGLGYYSVPSKVKGSIIMEVENEK